MIYYRHPAIAVDDGNVATGTCMSALYQSGRGMGVVSVDSQHAEMWLSSLRMVISEIYNRHPEFPTNDGNVRAGTRT